MSQRRTGLVHHLSQGHMNEFQMRQPALLFLHWKLGEQMVLHSGLKCAIHIVDTTPMYPSVQSASALAEHNPVSQLDNAFGPYETVNSRYEGTSTS